mmetsp:Transcript_18563/g.38254  ORF Transcript_18563/g.38254 Transcript_18563/m.38254 type:complete len:90 (-) Transcript_18563:1454-1723(-)
MMPMANTNNNNKNHIIMNVYISFTIRKRFPTFSPFESASSSSLLTKNYYQGISNSSDSTSRSRGEDYSSEVFDRIVVLVYTHFLASSNY